MARGKHGTLAANRNHHEALERIKTLERELAETKAAARSREVELQEKLSRQGVDVSRRTAQHVHELMIQHTERLADGVANAAWQAQRVAMTEHLTWLFLQGYATWDRMDGDREVLKFIATHGDLKAWFRLTGKYAHLQNHKDRRLQAKVDPVREMLAILREIERADGKADLVADRKKLDDVVDYARLAFMDVELQEVLTDAGWETVAPTDEAIAVHQEIIDTLPAFQRLKERVG